MHNRGIVALLVGTSLQDVAHDLAFIPVIRHILNEAHTYHDWYREWEGESQQEEECRTSCMVTIVDLTVLIRVPPK